MKAVYVVIVLGLLVGPVYAGPGFVIKADIPGDSTYADSILAVTAERLGKLIGPVSIDSLEVYIVATEAKFAELAGNSIPDWGAAVAIPFRKRIVIKSPLILPGDKSLGELVAHEFSHIALASAAGGRRVPRWLDEGLAMYMSAEWGWSDNISISWSVVIGNAMPLTDIEQLNRFGSDRAQIAYSEAYLAVKYFIDIYGVSGLRLLLDNIRRGRTFDEAFIAATGWDYERFEQEFSTYLHGRYNLVTLIFNSNVLWILLALIFILGIVLSRLRRKKRLDEFDEYDKYHSTDFDYGNVEEPDEDKPWD